MSKAILIMDMPESCYRCIFCTDDYECILADKEDVGVDGYKKRSDCCPLRPLPERKGPYQRFESGVEVITDYAKGWNACLDEIGGGE